MRRSVERRWARPLTVPTAAAAAIPRSTRLRMINSDYHEGAEVSGLAACRRHTARWEYRAARGGGEEAEMEQRPFGATCGFSLG